MAVKGGVSWVFRESHSNSARGIKRLCHFGDKERETLSRSRARKFWSRRRRYIESIREDDLSCISDVPKTQVSSEISEKLREGILEGERVNIDLIFIIVLVAVN